MVCAYMWMLVFLYVFGLRSPNILKYIFMWMLVFLYVFGLRSPNILKLFDLQKLNCN
jgi:hypothetical protein